MSISNLIKEENKKIKVQPGLFYGVDDRNKSKPELTQGPFKLKSTVDLFSKESDLDTEGFKTSIYTGAELLKKWPHLFVSSTGLSNGLKLGIK